MTRVLEHRVDPLVARTGRERTNEASMRDRLRAAHFDDLYASDPDPWEFETSEYEAAKYAATIEALQGRRYQRGLEIGCSIGVLTEQLAQHCDEVLGIDVVEAPLQRARERVPTARFERREIPEESPPGHFDLTVCSEVLYYLDEPAFRATLEKFSGTTLLAVHWRPPTQNYPFGGDDVHTQLITRFGPADYSRDTAKYVLDRWDRCGS